MSSELVHLDLGTLRITTTKRAIQREPNSILAQTVSNSDDENNETEKPLGLLPYYNNTIYLNRNPMLVNLLVNALRNPKMECVLPDNFNDWSALLAEVSI